MIERLQHRAVMPGLLLFFLGAAWLSPDIAGLTLDAGDSPAAAGFTSALDGLEPDPLVLVGFDPDLGTYAEIRPTVRAVMADLLARGARLAFVSVTVEGRALASAELARLGRAEVDSTRILDLGFVAGAEAALVDLTRDLRAGEGVGGRAFAHAAAAGIGAFDAIVVVGGNDLGPRSWVEQVAPRVAFVPLLAVTPTMLLPEVQPYVASGQLGGLIGTIRDGASYRASLEVGNLDRFLEPREPRTLPLLVGIVVAVALMGQALVRRLRPTGRAVRERDAT